MNNSCGPAGAAVKILAKPWFGCKTVLAKLQPKSVLKLLKAIGIHRDEGSGGRKVCAALPLHEHEIISRVKIERDGCAKKVVSM